MAIQHILRKIFSNFKGLDKRSSHITRTAEHAVEAKNVRYRKSGAISKRKGTHIACGDFKGGYGLTTYKKIDSVGAVSDELISVGSDGKLYRLLERDITITVDEPTISWSGAQADVTDDNKLMQYYVSNKVNPDTKEFLFTISRDNKDIISYNLGTGLNSPDSTITNLISVINSATIGSGICSNPSYTDESFCTANSATWTEPSAELTATVSNNDILTKKAAFIDTLSNNEIIYGTPLVLKYRIWEEIPMGDTSYQGGKSFTIYDRDSNGQVANTELENASFAQLNNVLYISNGYDEVMKYDGDKIYRAGLPAPTHAPELTAVSLGVSSAFQAGNTKCIEFATDTTNEYFEMGSRSDFNDGGDEFFFRRRSDRFTISFWANFDALNSSTNPSDDEHIFSVGDVEFKGFRVYSRDNQIAISFGVTDDNYGTLNFGNQAWGDGKWHHYTITYDGPSFVSGNYATYEIWGAALEDNLKLYRDAERVYANSNDITGSPFGSDREAGTIGNCSIPEHGSEETCEEAGGTWTDTAKLRLGFPNYSYNNHTNLKGKYDEIAIWKTILPQVTITSIYNNGVPNDISLYYTSFLKRYYRLEGSPYTDSAGNFTGVIGSAASNTALTSDDSIYLPVPTAIGLDETTSSNFYFYKYTYEYTDELGNIISSEPSPVAKVTVPSNQTHGISVDYRNLQLGTGFNIGGSTTNGKIRIKIYRTKATATEATEAGEIYYLVNSFALPYRPSTSSAMTAYVNYNALPAYGGSAWEIHNGITHNDETKLISKYLDFLEDSDVGGTATTFTTNELLTYQLHPKRQDPPPKGKYITAFQDCLIISGQLDNVNNFAYSLPSNAITLEIGAEYFPNNENQAIVESSFGDKITAIAPLKDVLYIFHKNSIHTLTGSLIDLTGLSYQVDLLTAEGGIGCEAHATIQELGSNLFFLSNNGIYSINNSEGFPKEVSLNIQPEFKEAITTFNRKKAISFNWGKENILIFLLPTEQLDDGASTSYKYLTTSSESKIFVFDYSRQAWLEWSNIDFSGGITEVSDTIYFNSRSLDNSNEFISYLHKIQDNNNTFDYVDGTEAIPFTYKTSWEAMGEPTIPKKFLRIKTYAFDADDSFESPSFILNANIEKNYINQSTGTVSLDFGGGTAGGWGGSVWSTAPWGSRVLDSIKSKLPTGKAKSLAISFENNTINENILLSGYELEIAGPYKKEIKE